MPRTQTWDDSRWLSQRVHLSGAPSTPADVSLHYIICHPVGPHADNPKGTIVLIHGFPETSYQFRHVITPLADAGYVVIAPDYRGAGNSSHPREGFEKVQMATDIHELLQKHLDIKSKVHIVGHDIGGMVAHAYATTFPDDTATVIWGECPLPGTKVYDKFVKEDNGVWHFIFHWQTDLPEALTYGRERIYLKHFYDRLCVRGSAITPEDVDHYAHLFAQPGGMRCGFDVYREFHQDAKDNQDSVKEKGKCTVPCQTLNGDGSFLAGIAKDQALEMYEDAEAALVDRSGHWIAEENPEGFVKHVLAFVGKHST